MLPHDEYFFESVSHWEAVISQQEGRGNLLFCSCCHVLTWVLLSRHKGEVPMGANVGYWDPGSWGRGLWGLWVAAILPHFWVPSLPSNSGFPSSFHAVTGLKKNIGDEGQASCVIAGCRLLRDLALGDVTSWNLTVSSFLCCPAIPTKPTYKICSSSCSKSLFMQKGRNYKLYHSVISIAKWG